MENKAPTQVIDAAFLSWFAGDLSQFAEDDATATYEFVAYKYEPSMYIVNAPKVLLATTTRLNNPDQPPMNSSPSSFGDLPHHRFELQFPNSSITATMEAWGIVCGLHYQFGTMNLERSHSSPKWSHSNLAFPPPDPESDPWPFTWLTSRQPPENYHAPVEFPGPGAAIAGSARELKPSRYPERPPKAPLNFTRFALNYLYVSAILEDFIFNVDRCAE
jgi:hypothetical protein